MGGIQERTRPLACYQVDTEGRIGTDYLLQVVRGEKDSRNMRKEAVGAEPQLNHFSGGESVLHRNSFLESLFEPKEK